MEHGNICVYCGDSEEIEREHVIPAVFYVTRSFDPNLQWIVSACRICNSLAGSHLFFSIPEKADYIIKRYKTRYKKLLKMPYWSEEELNEMGYKLKNGIQESMLMRLIILRRIRQLEVVTDFSRDYLRPKWVEFEYKKYRAELLKAKRDNKKKLCK